MAVSPTVVALLLTTLVLLGLTAMAWRFRDNPGVRIFGVLQAMSALWAALTLVGLSLSPGPLRIRLWGATNAISLVVIVLWLGFILRYTGREEWLSRRLFGLASLPLGVGAVLYVLVPEWSPMAGQVTQSMLSAGTVVSPSVGPAGAVLGVYIYVVFAIGLVLVGKTVLEGNSLFVGQAAALGVGTVVTVAASALTIIGVPMSGYPTTQVALGPQTLFWGYAVFGQQFLQTVPAVSRIGERAVLGAIDEGVLVVDDDGTVIRANDRARSYIDVDEVVGRSVRALCDEMGVSGLADLPAQFQSGRGRYRATVSPISDWRGETIGQALVLQDVTQLLRRQQRLQVLNRILRHNVRNDMNVVLGVASQLRGQPAEDLAAMGETLYDQAASLTTISEKAIEIDRLLDAPPTFECVDLEALIEGIVSPLAAEHPAATVTTTVSTDVVSTDRRLLATVITELLENALEHTGEAPAVSVEGERANGQVRITVSDDGPGIPRTEVDPIVAGEETDLQHTSSLGVWLVYWGVQTLGGDVDFTSTEGGSTVTVMLPQTQTDDMTRPAELGRTRGTDE